MRTFTASNDYNEENMNMNMIMNINMNMNSSESSFSTISRALTAYLSAQCCTITCQCAAGIQERLQ